MTCRAGMAATFLALLAACSSSPDAAAPDVTPAPAASERSTSDSGAAQGAEDGATDTAADTVPACGGLLLAEGGELAGEDLGACLGAVLATQGPARKDVATSTMSGTVEFTYAPSFAASIDIEADFPVRAYVDESRGWLEMPTGWVEAVDGGGPDQQMAHSVVSIYRAAADIRAQVAMFASIPVWDVVGPEELTRPDGITVPTWRIEAPEPFDYGPVVTEELILWIDDERRIVQESVTSSYGSTAETTVARYYDFGADIEFAPPVG